MLRIVKGEIQCLSGAFVPTLGHSIDLLNGTKATMRLVPWSGNSIWVLCLDEYQKNLLGMGLDFIAITKKENSIFTLT